jgi:hypothetical protein
MVGHARGKFRFKLAVWFVLRRGGDDVGDLASALLVHLRKYQVEFRALVRDAG